MGARLAMIYSHLCYHEARELHEHCLLDLWQVAF